MQKIICLLTLLSLISMTPGFAQSPSPKQTDQDRIIALDQYWSEISRTVGSGDFEGYARLYHPDAVVVFATKENAQSIPIAKALAGWKQGFEDTRAGKGKGEVLFRFSQRIGDETTAFEQGIFKYTFTDASGSKASYVHFDMLFVKKDGVWLSVMENQKAMATEAEWEELK